MMSFSSLFGSNDSSRLFATSRNCVLTTLTAKGHPQAHRVRVAARSDDRAHLWFVVTKDSGIADAIERDPNVMLSVMNRDTQQLVHMPGVARVAGAHHNPVYLAPGFHQTEALSVNSDEMDIALLRVDLGEGRPGGDATDDSYPPHQFFRMFQTDPGNANDTGMRRGSQ
jgi:hypothetical protein